MNGPRRVNKKGKRYERCLCVQALAMVRFEKSGLTAYVMAEKRGIGPRTVGVSEVHVYIFFSFPPPGLSFLIHKWGLEPAAPVDGGFISGGDLILSTHIYKETFYVVNVRPLTFPLPSPLFFPTWTSITCLINIDLVVVLLSKQITL